VEAPLALRDANKDNGFIVQHDQCRILKVPRYGAKNDASSGEVKIFVPVLNFQE
jgi:hypothetical protein